MTRVHVCAHPGCPEYEPCPHHSRPRNARWSKHRDGAQHMRFARAAKKAQPWCTRCGATEKLDAHHGPSGEPIVLCNTCHTLEDEHARAR